MLADQCNFGQIKCVQREERYFHITITIIKKKYDKYPFSTAEWSVFSVQCINLKKFLYLGNSQIRKIVDCASNKRLNVLSNYLK